MSLRACLILSFFVLTTGCINRDTKSDYSSSLNTKSDSQNLLVESPDLPSVVLLNPTASLEAKKLSELFEIEKVVILDTPALVGAVSKVQFMGKRIYVLDKKNAKRLFCFSENGNFLWEYNRSGGGPYEFQRLLDFTINPYLNTIDLFDGGGRKIIQLDTLGNPIREFDIDLFAQNLALVDSSQYIFYTGNIVIDQKLRYKLVTVNDQSDVVSKNFAVSESDEEFRFGLISNLTQNFCTDNLYFTEILNDTVYRISKRTLYRDMVVNFGKHKISREEAHRVKAEFLMEYTQKKALVSSIDGLCEADSTLFFLYAFNGTYRKVLLNKKTKEYHQYERLINDFFRLGDTMISASDGNNFVIVLEPYYIHAVYATFKDVFAERYRGISDTMISDSLERFTPLFVDAVKKTKIDSNPFLVFIKLKK